MTEHSEVRPILARASGESKKGLSAIIQDPKFRHITPGDCECGEPDCRKKEALEMLPGDSMLRLACQWNETLDEVAMHLAAMADYECQGWLQQMVITNQVDRQRQKYADEHGVPVEEVGAAVIVLAPPEEGEYNPDCPDCQAAMRAAEEMRKRAEEE